MDANLEQFFDAFFTLDAEGRFTEAQGKINELFQRSAAELEGQVIWELFPQLAGGTLQQRLQATQATGQAQRIGGALLPCEGWVEIILRPMTGGVECYVRDISAYRQDQPGPTHDETGQILFDALLQHIPEAILIADASDTSFLVASRYACEIIGIPTERLLKFKLPDLQEHAQFFEPGSDQPVSLQDHPLTRFIERGESAEDLEYDLVNARGERSTISVKGGPITNQDGQIIAGILSWMDTSERKRHQEILEDYARRLEQSNRDLETFAYSASHDLLEPLRKVKSFSEMLERKYGQAIQGEGQDILRRLKQSSVRMQALINDLLVYSRLSTQETNPTRVDLNDTLREVLGDLETSLSRTGGLVDVGRLPAVQANPARMQQLFLNLVGNGLKFHRPGVAPRVGVYAARTERRDGREWVWVAVQDNGIGFQVEELDRLVQPFVRLHGRSDYEGSGIGLAICRRIVEQLGGELTAESAPGHGSTFWVSLPLASASSPA